MTLVVQAAVLDGLLFDASPFSQDGFTATEVDVSRGEVSDALVVAVVVVVIDESGNGCFEFALEEVVFQQDAVLQGLVPSLDLSLCLGVHWRAANVLHAFFFEIFCQIGSDVRRAIVAEQPGFVQNLGAVAA